MASASHLRLDKELPRWLEIETALLGVFCVLCFVVLFCFLVFGWKRFFVKLKPWCIEGFAGAHSQWEWVGFKNESVTVCFYVDTFRQAFGPLVTAFPLSTEGYWLTKPLPGLTATTAISCSVLHFPVSPQSGALEKSLDRFS